MDELFEAVLAVLVGGFQIVQLLPQILGVNLQFRVFIRQAGSDVVCRAPEKPGKGSVLISASKFQMACSALHLAATLIHIGVLWKRA